MCTLCHRVLEKQLKKLNKLELDSQSISNQNKPQESNFMLI